MQGIREYLLCVLVASILCAIIRTLVKTKGTLHTMVKLVTGLLLVITLLSPFEKVRGFSLPQLIEPYSNAANDAVTAGKAMAEEATAEIIKDNIETYIMDKAAYLGMSVSVEVVLSYEPIPHPVSVALSGTGSPYAKNRLSKYISQDLGIPEDAQTWT